jgi:hypothetical protein
MKKILLLFSLIFATCAAHASELQPRWELSGSSSVSLGKQYFGDGSNTTSLSIGTRVTQFFTQQVAEFASAGFVWSGASNSGANVTSFSLVVGPEFNFSRDTQNSFYVLAGGGLMSVNTGTPNSLTNYAFKYLVGLGRRVQIIEHVTWSPEFQLGGYTGSTATDGSNISTLNSSVGWGFVPINFSVILD